jgi:DNA topoisomerase I
MSSKGTALVIVESPAKARTIAGFLGKDFVVESSIGHVRDLPKSADDIPLALKKTAWAKLGVDVENDFKPLYVVDADKKQHVAHLKTLLKDADLLYLATDEDREGESIAWHLVEVLQPKVPVKRMVFHEITKKAIEAAISSPRQIDRRLVNAQEARRILDRLYGYEVSPVLWKKVLPRLSAGRVQSVATRILVERERERMKFRPAVYWDLEATVATEDQTEITATLVTVDGKRLATGKDFDTAGKLVRAEALVLDEAAANALVSGLEGKTLNVSSIEKKPYKRQPSPPFMTSTLQQEASRKLRFSAQRTMKAAQRLYEGGYITYMRTDSTTLSETALTAARRTIEELFGAEHVPAQPRAYANKVKNAQEAHEAIRPAGDTWRTPDEVSKAIEPDQAKVYELVWKRTVASQMKDAVGETVSVRIAGTSREGRTVELTTAGLTITFPGFFRAYVEGSDDPDAELENREKHLPPLSEGDPLAARSFRADKHETQPPARYTEASLVRRLEELGVGRPSTYASTIGTIQDRGYVIRKGNAMVPSFTAFAVVSLLEKHFPRLVDYAFTAKMEDDLDAIASGTAESIPWLRRFYFGQPAANDTPLELGLRALVNTNLGEIDARAVNSIPIGKDPAGVDIIARVGRYGPYLSRGEDTVSIPEDMAPDELTVEKSLAMLAAPSGDREVGIDPATGMKVLARAGRFGAYVQLGEAQAGGKGEKPKTASLFASMSHPTLTLEEALKLLSLPRTIGQDPADGVPITVQNGRFGPYISKGTDSRSLTSEDQIFSITLPEALALLAQPKERGRRRAGGQAAPPLKELGEDPVSKKKIVVKEGRFGNYVTDGDTNATLRKGDSPESITPERAQELLAERRDREASGQVGKRGKRGGRRGPISKAQKPAAAKAPKAEKPPKAAKAAKAAKPKAEKPAAKAKAPAGKKAAKKASASDSPSSA